MEQTNDNLDPMEIGDDVPIIQFKFINRNDITEKLKVELRNDVEALEVNSIWNVEMGDKLETFDMKISNEIFDINGKIDLALRMLDY